MSGLLGALFGRLRKRDLEEEPAELQQTADEALERVAGDATGRSQIELLQRTVDEMARKLEERNKRSNRNAHLANFFYCVLGISIPYAINALTD